MLLDDQLSEWDFRERHATRVDAPSERVWAALKQVSAADLPLVSLLFRLRGLPVRRSPLYELEGFAVLAEAPERELVVGAIGRPWKPRGGLRRDVDFRSFADPGYAKMALNVLLDGGTLSTETRVLLTDPRSRRAFRFYWLLIRPFSGLIRRLWLRAIATRAGRE